MKIEEIQEITRKGKVLILHRYDLLMRINFDCVILLFNFLLYVAVLNQENSQIILHMDLIDSKCTRPSAWTYFLPFIIYKIILYATKKAMHSFSIIIQNLRNLQM